MHTHTHKVHIHIYAYKVSNTNYFNDKYYVDPAD